LLKNSRGRIYMYSYALRLATDIGFPVSLNAPVA